MSYAPKPLIIVIKFCMNKMSWRQCYVPYLYQSYLQRVNYFVNFLCLLSLLQTGHTMVLIQDPEKWGSAGLPHVRCTIAGECLAAIDPLFGRDVCMMDIAEFQDCLQQGATDAAWHNF